MVLAFSADRKQYDRNDAMEGEDQWVSVSQSIEKKTLDEFGNWAAESRVQKEWSCTFQQKQNT